MLQRKLGDKLETGAKTERLLKNLSPFEQKKGAGSHVLWEIGSIFAKKSYLLTMQF